MKTRKFTALLMAMAMLLTFAACTRKSPADRYDETDTDTAGETKSVFRVGVIYADDPASGSADSLAHDAGITAMCAALGLEEDPVRISGVSGGNHAALLEAVESCIDADCRLIFGTDRGYAATMSELARDNPDVIFACVSDGMPRNTELDNFCTYSGRIYQPLYLAGIAAGLKSESGSVGFVVPAGAPRSSVNAFAMGVSRANPEVRVLVKHTDSGFDPEQERLAAEELIDMGCDVIGQCSPSTGPMLAAVEAELWACGYGINMSAEGGKAVLTSPLWNWGVYYTRIAKAVMEQTAPDANYCGGMEDGLVTLASLSGNCADGTKELVEEARQEILSGSNVFSGEIVDNNGHIVCYEDEALDEDDIYTMTWYYRNIELW